MSTINVSLPSDGQTIDASDVNSPINTIVAAINGNLDDDNIKSGANINGSKILAGSIPGSRFDTTTAGGWIVDTTNLPAPNTVTYNGNHNYSVVFNSTDLTDTLSPGMRLRFTRTVTAPTQCTDLEAGSSQYYSKTSPAGVTFTDDFTCMAWVKLESYAVGGIIARRNADTEGWSLGVSASGHITLGAYRIAGNNSVTTSHRSIPLNEWVHVAATCDLSGTSVLIYINGILVTSATVITGTITALVQGTTDLVVGAEKSAGTNPFDGKIAQAAVFNAVLSAATIRSYASQTLSGSETSLVSAYSFNNVITDLNTTNANNLTAQGSAVATNADSPFAGGASAVGGYTAGTTEFGEVFDVSFSTNTTVVVQVPVGYALPTSGGLSAIAYSVAAHPIGWPGLNKTLAYAMIQSSFSTTATPNFEDVSGLSCTFYVPKGRKVKAIFFAGRLVGNGNAYTQAIRESSTSLTQLVAAHSISTESTLQDVITASSGSHTYKASIAQNGAGTLTIGAGAGGTVATNGVAYLAIELD